MPHALATGGFPEETFGNGRFPSLSLGVVAGDQGCGVRSQLQYFLAM